MKILTIHKNKFNKYDIETDEENVVMIPTKKKLIGEIKRLIN